MSDTYLVEIDDHAAGILVPSGAAYAFHCVAEPFRVLEGQEFPHAVAAEMAVRRLARGRKGQSR